MRKDITIEAAPRSERGKNAARRLRATGGVPAVLYGGGGASIAISVSPREINRVLHSKTGQNTIFDVSVSGGEKSPVMIVDALSHPVKGALLHVDLKRIDLTQRLRVKVPVHTTGEPVGVKVEGGMFEVINREIEIECLPDDIPEHFTVDVSELHIGNNLRASQIPLADSMKLVGVPDMVLAHVVMMRVEETPAEVVAEPVEGEVKAEPEVIKKGKKEEEVEPPVEEKGKKK